METSDSSSGPSQTDRMVRKSVYGRTQLFLPSATTLLREVKCNGGVTRHDTASVYHVIAPCHGSGREVACWHCCDSIPGGDGMPIPRAYDSTEHKYHVIGRVCCPGCAKAYILEHTSYERGQHLNVLVKFLREVYGVVTSVVETPPRPSLVRFGGPFDPRTQPRTLCQLVEPPFVSYCMLASERIGVPTPLAPPPSTEADDALDEPQLPGLYTNFLARQNNASSSSAKPSSSRRTSPAAVRVGSRRPGGIPSDAPLARFIKPRTSA